MPAIHKLLPDGRVKVLSEDGSVSYVDKDGGVTKESDAPAGPLMPEMSGAANTAANLVTKSPLAAPFHVADPNVTVPSRTLTFPEQVTKYVRTAAGNPSTALEMAGQRVAEAEHGMVDQAMSSPSSIRSPIGLGLKAGAGTLASMGIDIGTPTPSNAALQVGGGLAGEFAAPFISKIGQRVDDALGVPTLKARAAEGFKNLIGRTADKIGPPAGEADAGNAIKQSFEGKFAPREAIPETQAKNAQIQQDATAKNMQLQQDFQAKKAQSQADYEAAVEKQKSDFEATKSAADDEYRKAVENERKSFEQNSYEKQKKFSNDQFNALASKYGDKPIAMSEAGTAGKQEFDKTVSSLSQKSSKLYEMLSEKMGDKPITQEPSAVKFIKSVFDEQGVGAKEPIRTENRALADAFKQKYGFADEDVAQAMGQMDALKSGQTRLASASLDNRTLGAYEMMNSVKDKLMNPDLTVKDLSRILTDVGRYAWSGPETGIKKIYRALYGEVANDASHEAEVYGYKGLSQGAKSVYRKLKTLQDSRTSDILAGDPYKAVEAITKSPTTVSEYYSNVGQKGQDTLKRAFLDNVRSDAQDPYGNMDYKKTYRRLNGTDDEIKKAVFGNDFPQVKRFENFAKLASESDTFTPSVEKPKLQKPAPVPRPADVPRPEYVKPQYVMPPEIPTPDKRVAALVRGREPEQVIDSIVRGGKFGTRAETLMNNMDETGIRALKRGILDNVARGATDKTTGQIVQKDFAEGLNKLSDESIKKVYGKDANLVFTARDIANAEGGALSKSFFKDMLHFISFFHSPSAAESVGRKFMLPSQIRSIAGESAAKEILPKSIFQQAGVRPGVARAATLVPHALTPYQNDKTQ